LEVKLPDGDMRLPSKRYAVVDMYGQCCAVEFRGLKDVSTDDGDGMITIQTDKDELTHVKQQLLKKSKTKLKHQEQQAVGGATMKEPELPGVVDDQQQIEPEMVLSEGNGHRPLSQRSVIRSTPHFSLPAKRLWEGVHTGSSSHLECPYYKYCQCFLKQIPVPGRLCHISLLAQCDVYNNIMYYIL
jgi:hypothetical protein